MATPPRTKCVCSVVTVSVNEWFSFCCWGTSACLSHPSRPCCALAMYPPADWCKFLTLKARTAINYSPTSIECCIVSWITILVGAVVSRCCLAPLSRHAIASDVQCLNKCKMQWLLADSAPNIWVSEWWNPCRSQHPVPVAFHRLWRKLGSTYSFVAGMHGLATAAWSAMHYSQCRKKRVWSAWDTDIKTEVDTDNMP